MASIDYGRTWLNGVILCSTSSHGRKARLWGCIWWSLIMGRRPVQKALSAASGGSCRGPVCQDHRCLWKENSIHYKVKAKKHTDSNRLSRNKAPRLGGLPKRNVFLLLVSSIMVWWFSFVRLGSFPLYFLCIYCRVFVCSYHEVNNKPHIVLLFPFFGRKLRLYAV